MVYGIIVSTHLLFKTSLEVSNFILILDGHVETFCNSIEKLDKKLDRGLIA